MSPPATTDGPLPGSSQVLANSIHRSAGSHSSALFDRSTQTNRHSANPVLKSLQAEIKMQKEQIDASNAHAPVTLWKRFFGSQQTKTVPLLSEQIQSREELRLK